MATLSLEDDLLPNESLESEKPMDDSFQLLSSHPTLLTSTPIKADSPPSTPEESIPDSPSGAGDYSILQTSPLAPHQPIILLRTTHHTKKKIQMVLSSHLTWFKNSIKHAKIQLPRNSLIPSGMALKLLAITSIQLLNLVNNVLKTKLSLYTTSIPWP